MQRKMVCMKMKMWRNAEKDANVDGNAEKDAEKDVMR